ncbi:MAG TPA: glycosyltransferase family 39 protein [Candidatus Bathyarchaeia archaeon]|nr:glycosyltransferase family 39 protein [Candidatus Bathyarchaeia archaeon]
MENADSPRTALSVGEWLTVGILVGGAFLFRLAFLACRPVLSGDEVHYAEALFRFLHGHFLAGVSDYWSFLYPFAAIPFGFVARDAETGLRLLSALSGAALIVPAFLIARRLWGRRVAVFAGLFIAFQANLVSFSTAAITEPLYSLLLLCAVLFVLDGARPGGAWRNAGAGILLALAYLTRPEATAVLAILIVAVLARRGGAEPRVPPGARVRRSIAMAALFIVVLIPYLFLLHAATGRWTTGSKAAVNLSSPVIWTDGLAREEYVYSLNDQGTGRRIEEAAHESALKVLWREKGSIASQYPAKLNAGLRLVPLLFSSPFLLLLALLGLFMRRPPRQERGAELVLLALGVFPFAFYSMFRVELRYLIPYLPVYLLWAGAGCATLLDWFAQLLPGRRVLSSALVAFIFLSLVPYTIHKGIVAAKTEPRESKAIGLWIREHEGPGARILAKPGCSISYYAGNPIATYIPWTDAAGLVRFARINRYAYVVIDEEYVRAMRPLMRSILDSPPRELEAIGEFKNASGGRIILYRLKPLA